MILGPRTTARIYLREGTGIREQYYIYCSPILMLQAGIGFEGLRRGHKKCPVFNGTHVARVANGPLALSGLCRGDATRLQLETRYIKSPRIGLYNRCRDFCLTSLSSLGRARETHRIISTNRNDCYCHCTRRVYSTYAAGLHVYTVHGLHTRANPLTHLFTQVSRTQMGL